MKFSYKAIEAYIDFLVWRFLITDSISLTVKYSDFLFLPLSILVIFVILVLWICQGLCSSSHPPFSSALLLWTSQFQIKVAQMPGSDLLGLFMLLDLGPIIFYCIGSTMMQSNCFLFYSFSNYSQQRTVLNCLVCQFMSSETLNFFGIYNFQDSCFFTNIHEKPPVLLYIQQACIIY